MPDENGQLTPEELGRAQVWLSTHWTNPICPFHGPTNWEVGGIVGQVLAFTGGGLTVGGPVYPFIVVSCSICGYSVLVNALKVGIISPSEPPAQPTTEIPEGR